MGYDSAIAFSRGWDEELIEQFEATSNEMAILTTYLSAAKIYRNEMKDDVEARRDSSTRNEHKISTSLVASSGRKSKRSGKIGKNPCWKVSRW